MNDNKRKCIIQVLPALNSGGVERGTLEMAEAIVKNGWRSIVISSGGRLEQRLIRRGTEHITLPVNSKNPLAWIVLKYKLKNIFLKEQPDIVHVRSRVPAWTAGSVARSMKIPLISTVHGRYFSNSFVKKIYNRVLLKANTVIAISNYVKHNILKTDSWSENKITVIHRGADTDIFNPSSISENRIVETSKLFQLPDDAQIIMLPARPTRWKGHELLIEAFSKIANDKLFCVMPGADDQGTYLASLNRSVKKYGVEGRVTFLKFLDDLPAAYMFADVVVVASLTPEPFGRVAIEAQAMERPIVAFDHGGVAESIINGKTGILVKPGDVKQLEKAIVSLLKKSSSQRVKMGKKARKHILDNFSLLKMTERTLDLYKNTIKDFKNNA